MPGNTTGLDFDDSIDSTTRCLGEADEMVLATESLAPMGAKEASVAPRVAQGRDLTQ